MADSTTTIPTRDFSAAPSSSSSGSRSRSPVQSTSGQVPLSRGMQLLARAIQINLTLIAICCGSDELEAIEFAQYFNLIPKFVICTVCGAMLQKITCTKRSNASTYNYSFKCFKRSCRKNYQIFQNTWFEGRHISTSKCITLTYCFLKKMSQAHIIEETSGVCYGDLVTSSEAVSDNNSYCREVMIDSLFLDGEVKKIGGANCTVEIDEAKFGKRKFNRGRMVEGQWVLGGICRETKETFFVPVEDRTSETLIGLIKKHVKTGSILHTDCFKSYNTEVLVGLGYQHLTVNHSEEFVNRETGCHTNTIEGTWWAVKRSLPSSGNRKPSFAAYLAEYIWHKKNSDAPCKFRAFLKDVAKLYPGNVN